MKPHNANYRFDKLAWTIAIGSLLGVGVVLWFVSTYTMRTYENLYADRAADALASHHVDTAQESIADFFRGPPILGLFRNHNDPVRRAGEDTAMQLARISAELSPKSLQPAASQVAELKKNLALMEDFPSPATSELAPLIDNLDHAAKHADSLQTALDRKAALVAQRSSALAQFNLVEKDAADLFSLTLPQAVAGAAVPTFYSDGVLANLPKLPGLPDGIPTLEDLQKYLTAAGGNVKLSSLDAPTLFNQKLSSLQNSAVSVSSAFTQVSSQLTELDQSSSQLSQQVQGDVEELTSQFRDTLRSFMLQIKR